jgi:hypothetical protein
VQGETEGKITSEDERTHDWPAPSCACLPSS